MTYNRAPCHIFLPTVEGPFRILYLQYANIKRLSISIASFPLKNETTTPTNFVIFSKPLAPNHGFSSISPQLPIFHCQSLHISVFFLYCSKQFESQVSSRETCCILQEGITAYENPLESARERSSCICVECFCFVSAPVSFTCALLRYMSFSRMLFLCYMSFLAVFSVPIV